MKNNFNKNLRTRNWTFVLYPDSMPDDYLEILHDLKVPFAISPLHDKDINPDGTPKKPHYHVLLTYDGVKSYRQVCFVTDSLNATIPQICESVKGLLNYFTHKDNPEKFQYDKTDIKFYNGFEPDIYFKPSSLERYKIISDMQDYIVANNIFEYSDFCVIACKYHYDDWFPLLCDNSTLHIKSFITSLRHKKENSTL